MYQPDHRHSNRVWFHNLGLSDENTDDGGLVNRKRQKWKMRTFDSILKHLNHTNVRNTAVDTSRIQNI